MYIILLCRNVNTAQYLQNFGNIIPLTHTLQKYRKWTLFVQKKYISSRMSTFCLWLVIYGSTHLMFKHWQDEDQVGSLP